MPPLLEIEPLPYGIPDNRTIRVALIDPRRDCAADKGHAHGADDDPPDEAGEEEGSDDRQGVELVEADRVRSAEAGLKSKVLQNCTDRNSDAKRSGLGSITTLGGSQTPRSS